jgi:hypothetical protein
MSQEAKATLGLLQVWEYTADLVLPGSLSVISQQVSFASRTCAGVRNFSN